MTRSSKSIPESLNKYTSVGIFDSGIGGLSILKEIHRLLPWVRTIYLADQANFPYGDKTPSQLKNIAYQNVKKLSKFEVDLIVVACNTATVHAISFLRKKFPQIIFVGTEPGVKPAAAVAKKGITILSSPQATKSNQLALLINKYINGVPVFNIGSLDLVQAIEKRRSNKEIITILRQILPENILSQTDVLVLGCTHFPLIKKQIQKYVGANVKVIDSGQAIAQRVASFLKQNNSFNKSENTKHIYLTTSNSSIILGKKFKSV
jgi:glutamate racemase